MKLIEIFPAERLAQMAYDYDRLDLSGCTGLTSVEGLPAGVKTLDLSGCTGLVKGIILRV